MGPLFAHEPVVWVAVGASLAFWHVVEARMGALPSARDGRRREWSLVTIAVLVWSSLAAGIVVSVHDVAPIAGDSWGPVAAGLLLIWTGLAFRTWSVHTLGRFFKLTVVIQDGHRVIDHGPYRLLRHPSYLGMIVAMTGLGVTEGDWASTAIMLSGTLAAFLMRIRVEERTLLAELGDEYAAYTKRTARLLPGVF